MCRSGDLGLVVFGWGGGMAMDMCVCVSVSSVGVWYVFGFGVFGNELMCFFWGGHCEAAKRD